MISSWVWIKIMHMIRIFFSLIFSISMVQAFDWQGHRGARGLYPENTIGSMQTALNYPVTTLELDVVISGDDQVVVSHEPWMNPDICLSPEGKRLKGSKINLRELNYAEIQKYDCGSLGNPRFAEQKKITVGKPLLVDLIRTLEADLHRLKLQHIVYNVEIKSSLQQEKARQQPNYQKFSDLVLSNLLKLLPAERFTIQSFDWRVLKYIKQKYPAIALVALREDAYRPQQVLDDLGFVPQVFSPHWKLLRASDVEFFKQQGSKVIPWTVNTVADMRQMKKMGVDGIITDYPNLISEVDVKTCPAGQNLFEGKCVKIPEHAIASDKNPGWICKIGFQQKRSNCVKIMVPKNASLLEDGKTWVCNPGFLRYRGSCKKNSKTNELLLSL